MYLEKLAQAPGTRLALRLDVRSWPQRYIIEDSREWHFLILVRRFSFYLRQPFSLIQPYRTQFSLVTRHLIDISEVLILETPLASDQASRDVRHTSKSVRSPPDSSTALNSVLVVGGAAASLFLLRAMRRNLNARAMATWVTEQARMTLQPVGYFGDSFARNACGPMIFPTQ